MKNGASNDWSNLSKISLSLRVLRSEKLLFGWNFNQTLIFLRKMTAHPHKQIETPHTNKHFALSPVCPLCVLQHHHHQSKQQKWACTQNWIATVVSNQCPRHMAVAVAVAVVVMLEAFNKLKLKNKLLLFHSKKAIVWTVKEEVAVVKIGTLSNFCWRIGFWPFRGLICFWVCASVKSRTRGTTLRWEDSSSCATACSAPCSLSFSCNS